MSFSRAIRRLSTSSKLVDVEYVTQAARKKEYCVAIIRMNNPPVNVLSSSFIASMNDSMKEITNSRDKVHGVVITSSLSNNFSAGLELNELFNTDRTNLESYWSAFQGFWYSIYSSQLPIVSAINGHCLAGGVVIAVASDYRIAARGNYSIGIPAAKIGVVTPPWVQANIKEVIGHRNTELMLSQAKLFLPEEAFKLNLIDEVCDEDHLLSNACRSLIPFMEVLEEPRVHMKLSLRHQLLENFQSWREKDRDEFVNFVLKPSVQENIKNFIKSFKK